jgi:prophage regulatory protein
MAQLVGVHEIAELLGVSRQRVDEITRTIATFPAPIASLRGGRVWKRAEIVAWARKTGRIP